MSDPLPEVPPPFRWDGPLLAAQVRGAQVRFTCREDDATGGLDLARYAGRPEVAASMEEVAGRIGIPVARWQQNRQVHGARVRHGGAAGDDGTDADGQVTTAHGVACVVLTADCLPVAVAGDRGVAMLHAGWRGLADGVLEAGVAALRAAGEHGPLEAVIGPAAGGCCYEVGPEVRAAFAADGVLARADAHPIDLPAIAARRLRAAGVRRIDDCGLCTMCTTAGGRRLWFSHRADGGDTGRQAGIAWLS